MHTHSSAQALFVTAGTGIIASRGSNTSALKHGGKAEAMLPRHPSGCWGICLRLLGVHTTTVLIADSTKLSQQLDPEVLREAVRAYQATAAEVIHQFEGHMA